MLLAFLHSCWIHNYGTPPEFLGSARNNLLQHLLFDPFKMHVKCSEQWSECCNDCSNLLYSIRSAASMLQLEVLLKCFSRTSCTVQSRKPRQRVLVNTRWRSPAPYWKRVPSPLLPFIILSELKGHWANPIQCAPTHVFDPPLGNFMRHIHGLDVV